MCKVHVLYCILLATFLKLTTPAPPRTRIFRKCTIVHEAVEVLRNRAEFRWNVWIRKFNRTTPVLEADYEILDPKVTEFQVWLEGYERLGMERIYKKSAISLSCGFCEFFTGRFFFNPNYGGFSQYGNMPGSCPIQKGNYSFRNFVFDDKYLPPVLPGKYWRMDIYIGPAGIKFDSNETAKMSYYFKIVYL